MFKIKFVLLFVFLLINKLLFAQNVSFILNEFNIENNELTQLTSDHSILLVSGFLNAGQVKTTGSYFINSNNEGIYPVSSITSNIKHESSESRWFSLSPTNQRIIGYGSVTGSNFSGGFEMQFKMQNIRQYAWKAGNYETKLLYSLVNYHIVSNIHPLEKKMEISIPGFIHPKNQQNNYLLTIDNLDYFRYGYQSPSINNFQVTHTLPFYFSMKTDRNNFTYTNDNSIFVTSNSPVSALQVMNTLPVISNVYRLSSSYQQLADRQILVGNLTNFQQQFFILAEDLQQYFLKKGTYSNTLNHQLKSSNSAYPLTNTIQSNLSIIVPDLSEIKVSDDQIDLKFDDREDYLNGVSKEIKKHLTVSKTSGYNVSIRAANPNFQFGASRIPVSILSIGPAQGEQHVLPIQSLSTNDQVLISSNKGAIDEYYDIKYSIAAEQVPTFLASPKGTYSATIIYTLTAQ